MSGLIVVKQDGSEQAIDAADGVSVMEAIRNAGVDELLALCGGCCSCATCHVYVDAAHLSLLPPMGQDEDDLLDASGARKACSRLSCQITFGSALDGMTVRIAPED